VVKNRIRVMLAEANTSAAKLAEKMPGMNKVCMSFIQQGIALPTREGMEAMCEELECKATDIYDEKELDLNVTRETERKATKEEAYEMARDKITINPDDEQVTIPLNSLEAPVRQRVEKRNHGHENQERVFFWFASDEKAALVKAVEGLGYRNLTEWMREMYRMTLKQYAALKLEGKTLHELIPPLVSQNSLATEKA